MALTYIIIWPLMAVYVRHVLGYIRKPCLVPEGLELW